MGRRKTRKKSRSTSRNKVRGAMVALGAAGIAAGVGAGFSELGYQTVGARGIVKHGIGFATGGPMGALGSVGVDVLAGRGVDLSLTIPHMPSLGGASSAAPTNGATFA